MARDQRYPLSWPFGWKRTPAAERMRSPFRETATVERQEWSTTEQRAVRVSRKGDRKVTMRTAVTRLQDQLDRLGATDVVLSTNVELTLVGEPHGGRSTPTDPGVACYFKLLSADRVLACDKWATVEENIAAVAAHIDALRRIDRYGVGTIQQAFAGYSALPPPSEDNRPDWRKTLGFKEFSPVTKEDVQINYRALAKRGPNDEGWLMKLNLAREAALRELGA